MFRRNVVMYTLVKLCDNGNGIFDGQNGLLRFVYIYNIFSPYPQLLLLLNVFFLLSSE